MESRQVKNIKELIIEVRHPLQSQQLPLTFVLHHKGIHLQLLQRQAAPRPFFALKLDERQQEAFEDTVVLL